MNNGRGSVFTDQQWKQLEEWLSLPPRQRQVAPHCFDGRNDKQIADAIVVAIPTV